MPTVTKTPTSHINSTHSEQQEAQTATQEETLETKPETKTTETLNEEATHEEAAEELNSKAGGPSPNNTVTYSAIALTGGLIGLMGGVYAISKKR